MRILAIRGCNLASLAGEFEIDLARGPLGGAGVFAIVGATGAGKSTLLDAMCVALFDRTPRLTNRSTVTVGRGDDDPAALGAQDVRTILRRGATAGYAEVDFESGDSRRYRARWSVRRARDRSDGNLQAQQITLTAIDSGERFGGTRTETLDAIHHRLGLSFDQFRRSALLAQGEFATFLRADGKDRSELLERMTGTEIYSRLSIAAHVKATFAEQQLRERRNAAQAIAVLDDEARGVVVVELAAAEAMKLAARSRLAIGEAAARWSREAELRDGALADAGAHHAAALAAVARAASERAELALRRRAEELRGPWESKLRLDQTLALARNELADAEAAHRRAGERQVAIAIRRGELSRLHEPVHAARLAAGLIDRVAATAAGVDAKAAAAASDAAWLAQRGGLGPEVAAWAELDARFGQRTAIDATIAAADRTLRGHADARGKLVKARTGLAVEQQETAGKLDEAKRKAQAFQQRRELTLDAAKRAEDEARTRCLEVDRLVALAAAARAAVVTETQLDAQLTALATAAETDRARYVAAETARATQTILRAERTRATAELRRAAGYEHARAELVDGDPCPLCGAEEHPWRDRGAFDDVIRAAELQLGEATAQLEAATTTLAEVDAHDRHRVVERARLDAARAAVLASTSSHAAIWRQQLTALGELLLVDQPASPAAEQLASERATSARARLDAARTTRALTEAATKAAADAQAEMQLAQASLDQLALRLADHDRRLAELDVAAERLRGEQTLRAERHAELGAELTAAIARWSLALPPADRARLAEPGSTATRSPTEPATPERLDRARARMAELATEWRAHAERVSEADALLAAALRELDRDTREAERGVAEHAVRLGHATERCDALSAELTAATRVLELARHDAAALAIADGAAEVIADEAEPTRPIGRRKPAAPVRLVPEREAQAPVRLVPPERQTAAPVSAPPEREELATDTLQRLLAGDAASAQRTIALLVGQLAELDRAVERAATLVAERRRHVEDHALTRPPSLAEAVRVADLVAAAHDADQQVARLAERLATDLDARARRAAAEQAIAVAEAGAEVDRVLGEVIGSHDGKLFRSFAQSLTLDSLLAVANAHLEELAPRYQLERVPKHDLELQVIDRDLGGEVRSVQSLSGGESFLVSLALALGLSSMSAHDVRVRTLLIDEGFGTLDPATLDSALSVLDALQSTGRQVGVISHVPALVERVGAHVRVIQRGGGRSEVVVAEA